MASQGRRRRSRQDAPYRVTAQTDFICILHCLSGTNTRLIHFSFPIPKSFNRTVAFNFFFFSFYFIVILYFYSPAHSFPIYKLAMLKQCQQKKPLDLSTYSPRKHLNYNSSSRLANAEENVYTRQVTRVKQNEHTHTNEISK